MPARAGRRFLLKPSRPLYRRTMAVAVPTSSTGLASIGIGSSSVARESSTTTGISSVEVSTSSLAYRIGLTTGLSAVGLGSSSSASLGGATTTTTGFADIGFGSLSHTLQVGALEAYTGENSDLLVPFQLTGDIELELPAPVPPIDFDGLPNPLVAPILVASDTAAGHLLTGTYQYAYAAWKGSEGQVTAPSPWSDPVTLTTEDTVTITYPTIDGADGYLVYRQEV